MLFSELKSLYVTGYMFDGVAFYFTNNIQNEFLVLVE